MAYTCPSPAGVSVLWKGVCPDQGLDAIPVLIQNLVNIAIFSAGALAVIFVIVGGIKYATSAGDPSRVKAAKQTLLYAIGGLVLALASGAIINTLPLVIKQP